MKHSHSTVTTKELLVLIDN